MLQSFWCRRYLRKMSDCFQKNVYQAAIARWLHLPHCMLPASVAKQVAEWSDHPLADFQEMVTLHLPKGHVHIEHMIIKSDGL